MLIEKLSGGTNPALRTFYYRLLRLISLCIQPLFVFDGPNKPPFKRNKRTGTNVASIPEYLAKELLKKFGLPYHLAPGEAEAECALLQREGLVDVVLSEDVDTLMFGSGKTMRNWSSNQTSRKIPTHVNLYDAETIKSTSGGMDRYGMVLVALMSGGDYVPQGIAGCGPKTACEAARAGFGHELCQIPRKDKAALGVWREKLSFELRTNENKHFRSKHKALKIEPNFPDRDVLGYYTKPAISTLEQISKLRNTIEWQQELNIPELRSFTAEAFDWRCISGAKKFIRNLAPVLLVRALISRSDEISKSPTDNLERLEASERELVQSVNGRRTHHSTDNTPELRIGFIPINIVPLDLDAEPPDEPIPRAGEEEDSASDSDGESVQIGEEDNSLKQRQPLMYDPSKLEKLWISESFVKMGVPLTVQDWEESFRNPKKYQTMKAKNSRINRTTRKTTSKTSDITQRTINSFANVTKPVAQEISQRNQDLGRHKSVESDVTVRPLRPLEQNIAVIELFSPPTIQVPQVETASKSSQLLHKRRQRSSFQRTSTLPTMLSPQPLPTQSPSHSSPIPCLDLAYTPQQRKTLHNSTRKRTRALCEDWHLPSSEKLNAWLRSPHNRTELRMLPDITALDHLATAGETTTTERIDPAPEDDNSHKSVIEINSSPLQPISANLVIRREAPEDDVMKSTKDMTAESQEKMTEQSLRKRFIHPRKSLKGSWKVSADVTKDLLVIDLSSKENSLASGNIARNRAWRSSQIDVLDLTYL